MDTPCHSLKIGKLNKEDRDLINLYRKKIYRLSDGSDFEKTFMLGFFSNKLYSVTQPIAQLIRHFIP